LRCCDGEEESNEDEKDVRYCELHFGKLLFSQKNELKLYRIKWWRDLIDAFGRVHVSRPHDSVA